VKEDLAMLALSITFLVLALVAGYFGFRGSVGVSWEGGKLFCLIFLILAFVTFYTGVY
jgi:uncharacterized membrane protein YtjA (UPF0391 family)